MLLTNEELLDNLEGNRRLTIRTIEAFPENDLFEFKPAEALRPFSEMVLEILHIERAYIRGIALKEWEFDQPYADVKSKTDLLKACEQVRAFTLKHWPKISDERLTTREKDPFFGGPNQSHFERLVYALENEIHHRGQGYIYLRLLGVEPPLFYER